MLGDAPEAHEVLSKTPRIEIRLHAKVCPEAFPIKASGNQDLTIDFTTAQLNDVLKSLTTVDLGEGRISGVRYTIP